MRAFRTDTLTELHLGLTETIANAGRDQLDVVTSADVQMHDVVAQAKSMVWDFDMKDMWLTPSRWSMMIRQYLDPMELVEWINRTAQIIGWKGRGISMLRTNMVKPRGGRAQGNKETRRWGSCMLAVSYKALPAPQITLYSRTSYLGYLAPLDISVAWMCGRYLAKVMGGKVEDMRFMWFNEAMQYHHFKSMAFMLNHQDEDRRKHYRRLLIKPEHKLKKRELVIIEGAPAIEASRKWIQKTLAEDARGDTLGDLSYNTYRRIKRRFHTEVLGFDYAQQFEGWSYYKKGPQTGEKRDFYPAYKPLPNTPIATRDFTPLGLPPFDNLYAVDYNEAEAAKASKGDDEE